MLEASSWLVFLAFLLPVADPALAAGSHPDAQSDFPFAVGKLSRSTPSIEGPGCWSLDVCKLRLTRAPVPRKHHA